MELTELPFDGLWDVVQAVTQDPLKKARIESLLQAAVTGEGHCRADTAMVVKAVYATRHLTATMGSSAAAAFEARAAYQIPADSTRADVTKAIGAYAFGASAPAAPGSSALPSDPDRYAQLMVDIDKVYTQADANSKIGFNGVKVGFAKSSGRAVSMDYHFDVPMAFGMRLVPLKLNPDQTLAGAASIAGSLFHGPDDPTLMRATINNPALQVFRRAAGSAGIVVVPQAPSSAASVAKPAP